MADKKPFALRIDAGILGALEKWAADEFRSVNGQIEWILHKALWESGRFKGGRDAPTGNQQDGQQGESLKK